MYCYFHQCQGEGRECRNEAMSAPGECSDCKGPGCRMKGCQNIPGAINVICEEHLVIQRKWIRTRMGEELTA